MYKCMKCDELIEGSKCKYCGKDHKPEEVVSFDEKGKMTLNVEIPTDVLFDHVFSMKKRR